MYKRQAWGWEPCTVEAVKAYKPESNSLGSGQVLHQPYEADKARLVLREMADNLSMDLVDVYKRQEQRMDKTKKEPHDGELIFPYR